MSRNELEPVNQSPSSRLKQDAAKPGASSFDYLFVLPWVHWGPAAGGYRVVYEIARRLGRDGFKTGLVFLLNNRFKSRGRTRLGRFLNRFPPFSTRIRLRESSRLSVVAGKEEFQNVSLILSSNINGISAMRVFATHFTTAFYVNNYAGNADRYYIIEHPEDDPAYSGELSGFARQSYSMPLRKIVTNRKMYQRFRQDKPLLLRLGFEKDFYRVTAPIETREQAVLVPLLSGEMKGAAYATDALRSLKEKMPEVKILAFGNLPEDQLPSFVNHYLSNFREESYAGPRNPALLEMYNTASVFMLPSLVEGFSLPTLEAMHSGCAVVVTDNGGVNEYIVPQFNGLMVPTKDSKQLEAAALLLLSNPAKRVEIAKNGLRTSEGFSFEECYQRFRSLMEVSSEQHVPLGG